MEVQLGGCNKADEPVEVQDGLVNGMVDSSERSVEENEQTAPHPKKPTTFAAHFRQWLMIAGPGLIVMLADTDAGCLITAGQTGAQWGYTLLPLQIILVPVVFMAQELTCRLAVVAKKGQTELILERWGKKWATVAVAAICITCLGAMVSGISGFVGVGQLIGMPDWASVMVMAIVLLVTVFTGSYRRVEKIALIFGLFELVFIITMVMAAPSPQKFRAGLEVPITNPSFLYIAAANVGAVVMPWMIFYQGSAVVEKNLTIKDLNYSRVDTMFGAALTQLIMSAIIVTTAGTVWDGKLPSESKLETVPDFADALTPYLGVAAGQVLFAVGILGGAMIGAIVVTLTATWAVSELMGMKRSLETNPREAPGFYLSYVICLLVGCGLFSFLEFNIIDVNVFIQIINALVSPLILFFLFFLSTSLPRPYALDGTYKYVVGFSFLACSLFGVIASIYGMAAGE